MLQEVLSHGEGDPVRTYLKLGPDVVDPRNVLKIPLFGLLLRAKRSRVEDMAIVLVHALRDRVQVPRLDCLQPFVDKFDLWGTGACWIGH